MARLLTGPFALLVIIASLSDVYATPHQDFIYVPVHSIPYSGHATPPPITAVAELRSDGDGSGDSEVKGRIVFVQPMAGGPVFMFGNITGLEEGQHGLSIYEYGDISEGCKSLGNHFNPHYVGHGGPADLVRHVGDLGNVRANAEGTAKISESDWAISLGGGAVNGIIGRSIAVHAGRDDLGRGGDNESLRSGNSGKVLACGVIGLARPRFPPLDHTHRHHGNGHDREEDLEDRPPKRR